MSQNIPPSTPGHSGSGDASARGYDQPEGNPYFNAQAAAHVPDLDAGAPQLRDAESQRVNRKALLFLAGIVGLLVLMILLVVRNTTADKDAPPAPREEAVVIPELPQTQAPAHMPEPPPSIAMAQDEPVVLPPLPPSEPDELAEAEAGPQGPSLLDRRIQSGESVAASEGGVAGDPYVQAVMASMPGAPPAQPQKVDPPTVAQFLNNPDALLVRGTYIRCVLETRIITDIPGFTSCIVTEPIYSINGRRLLLPKGSKVLGSYNMEPTGPRVSVVWDRITTPTGIDVTMSSPGVDGLGGAGHPGHYTAHWPSRISAALMISLISDGFAYAAAKNGPTTTTVANGTIVEQPFESSTARTMERLANQALDKAANRPATVTINQGTVVNVYVAKDVDFAGVLAR